MIRDVAAHRTDYAHIVDGFAQLGKNIADFDAALSIFLETERRFHEIANLHRVSGSGDRVGARHWLAVVLIEHRLWIESIDLRWAAIEEQKDDSFHFGRKVR